MHRHGGFSAGQFEHYGGTYALESRGGREKLHGLPLARVRGPAAHREAYWCQGLAQRCVVNFMRQRMKNERV
jgi:hypothetical protein